LKTSMARGGVDKKENLISSHETTRLHQILFLPLDTKTNISFELWRRPKDFTSSSTIVVL